MRVGEVCGDVVYCTNDIARLMWVPVLSAIAEQTCAVSSSTVTLLKYGISKVCKYAQRKLKI